MNKTLKFLSYGWMLFLGFIASSVTIDTFVLGGKLKLWWIAVANTTNSSPYSTDGQSNIVIIVVCLSAIVALAWIISTILGKDDEDVQEEEKKP